MPSTWLRRASAWLIAALAALLLLGTAGSPVNLASIAALAIAAVIAWSHLRPSANSLQTIGRWLPVSTHIVGPMRSSALTS
jgi:hypothetical protein